MAGRDCPLLLVRVKAMQLAGETAAGERAVRKAEGLALRQGAAPLGQPEGSAAPRWVLGLRAVRGPEMVRLQQWVRVPLQRC